MESILKRISQIAENEDIKITAFEAIIGASKGVLSRAIKNNTDIQSKWITYIVENYPHYNPEWLLTGKGEMLKEEKPVTIPTIRPYPKAEKEPIPIPKLPIEAYAGLGAGEFVLQRHDIEEYYLIPEFSNADFLIEVTGSSMQPKYNGGDVLACKHIQSYQWFQWGVPHIIHIKDRGVVVKRPYQTEDPNSIELRSDNERYPPFRITKEEIINISIVIGVIRIE